MGPCPQFSGGLIRLHSLGLYLAYPTPVTRTRSDGTARSPVQRGRSFRIRPPRSLRRQKKRQATAAAGPQRPAASRRVYGRRPPAAGWTLVELLVTLAVVALLTALLLPALRSARDEGRRVVCLSNLRQIGTAIDLYVQDEPGERYPIAHYTDRARGWFVTWDTQTTLNPPFRVEPGLIWRRFGGPMAVQQDPAYDGPSMTAADPYTGYNYNTTYIGRGENESPYRGMTSAPARASEVARPARTALVGDGGYRDGANKFMRAPHDPSPNLAVAGVQAYRHGDRTNVLYADGHGRSVSQRYLPESIPRGLRPWVGWPEHGFLSADDRAYALRFP